MSTGTPDVPFGREVVVMAEGDRDEASITGADPVIDSMPADGRWWAGRQDCGNRTSTVT